MHEMYESARSFLESALTCRLEQDRLIERIAHLHDRCTKITPTLSQVPGGGSSDAQAQWAALADEQRRLTEKLKEELERAREIETFIDSLPTELYRQILKHRYIDYQTIPAIRAALEHSGYRRSQRHVERLLGRALMEAEREWVNLKGDCTHEEPEDDQT